MHNLTIFKSLVSANDAISVSNYAPDPKIAALEALVAAIPLTQYGIPPAKLLHSALSFVGFNASKAAPLANPFSFATLSQVESPSFT